MLSDLCQSAHEKLSAGKCPWCGSMIVNGQTADERIVSAHQGKDTAEFERYRNIVRPILLSLDPPLFAVIELRYVKERTIEDIARELNLTIDEVTARLSQAKKIIREKIKKLEI